MSEVTTPVAETTSAPVKKVVKKAATKKVAKKVAPKKAAKKAATPRAKKDGLRKPQIRVLKLLAKKDGLDRNQISEKAPVDLATCVEYIGSHDPDIRAANDTKHFPSLISLGLVKAQMHDVKGKNVIQYFITAKGKAEAAKN